MLSGTGGVRAHRPGRVAAVTSQAAQEIRYIDALPRNAMGKVQKKLLE